MDVVDTSQLIARVSPRPAADRRLVFEPITAGFPFPAGVVRDPDRIGLLDDQGSPVAVQALATERWADGSVRWALLDFQAAGDVRDRQYTILCDAPVPQPLPRSRVEITEQDGGARVDTGAARFELRKGSTFPCAAASVRDVDAIDGAKSPTAALTRSSSPASSSSRRARCDRRCGSRESWANAGDRCCT